MREIIWQRRSFIELVRIVRELRRNGMPRDLIAPSLERRKICSLERAHLIVCAVVVDETMRRKEAAVFERNLLSPEFFRRLDGE